MRDNIHHRVESGTSGNPKHCIAPAPPVAQPQTDKTADDENEGCMEEIVSNRPNRVPVEEIKMQILHDGSPRLIGSKRSNPQVVRLVDQSEYCKWNVGQYRPE
jgi:hypothetical protein